MQPIEKSMFAFGILSTSLLWWAWNNFLSTNPSETNVNRELGWHTSNIEVPSDQWFSLKAILYCHRLCDVQYSSLARCLSSAHFCSETWLLPTSEGITSSLYSFQHTQPTFIKNSQTPLTDPRLWAWKNVYLSVVKRVICSQTMLAWYHFSFFNSFQPFQEPQNQNFMHNIL